MTATVTKLRPAKPVAKVPGRAAAKKVRRQGASAIAIGAVAATLTALSLSHLAHGISIVTGAQTWEAWAMATGIDLGFIGLELALILAASDVVRNKIKIPATCAIYGTLIASAAMNAFAFAAHCDGYMIGPAIVAGVAIPALIYCLTRVGASLYIDCHNKA